MQRGCHGWPASRELSELFLADLKGRAFVRFSFFFCTLPKILEILRTGSGLGGKKNAVSHHFILEAKASWECWWGLHGRRID